MPSNSHILKNNIQKDILSNQGYKLYKASNTKIQGEKTNIRVKRFVAI